VAYLIWAAVSIKVARNRKWKKRRPYTSDFIAAVKGHLNLSALLDAAVFACLTTFCAAARLGEFTVPLACLDAFNPALHVTPKNLSKDQDRGRGSWNGDPDAASDNHRLINNLIVTIAYDIATCKRKYFGL